MEEKEARPEKAQLAFVARSPSQSGEMLSTEISNAGQNLWIDILNICRSISGMY